MKKFFLSTVFLTFLLTSYYVEAKDLSFNVLRDGDKIGTHVFSISQNADQTRVKVRTRMKVKAAFITVFRYEHDRTEVWENGQLVSFDSVTHNDGDDLKLKVTRAGSALTVTDQDGRTKNIETSDLPVTFWNKGIMDKERLFSALDGNFYKISTREVGESVISINGKKYQAVHYKMFGSLERDLWYDKNGQLLKIKFRRRGSDIEYVRN